MNDITFIRTGLADVYIGSDSRIIVAIIAAYTGAAAGGADWACTVGWTTHTRLSGRIPNSVSRTISTGISSRSLSNGTVVGTLGAGARGEEVGRIAEGANGR